MEKDPPILWSNDPRTAHWWYCRRSGHCLGKPAWNINKYAITNAVYIQSQALSIYIYIGLSVRCTALQYYYQKGLQASYRFPLCNAGFGVWGSIHICLYPIFVSNGNIIIKKIFPCVLHTSIKSNDKLISVEALYFSVLMLRTFMAKPTRFSLL